MQMHVIETPIERRMIEEIATANFLGLVKAVVDIDREVMVLDGELHADQEALLIEHGSKQGSLWGINFHPGKTGNEWIEFDSMINLRPNQNNRTRGVDDPATQQRIREIVGKLVLQ